MHSKQEDMYVAATDSAPFLTDKSPRSVLPMLHHTAYLWESWSELTAKVKSTELKKLRHHTIHFPIKPRSSHLPVWN
ncbi:MAG: hypothetical protein ABRQ32_07375 [Smithellaceae bacterium]